MRRAGSGWGRERKLTVRLVGQGYDQRSGEVYAQ